MVVWMYFRVGWLGRVMVQWWVKNLVSSFASAAEIMAAKCKVLCLSELGKDC